MSAAAANRYAALHGLRPAEAAGLIRARVARQTDTVVGVYRSAEAGLEDDPDLPYATVCEDHGAIVCHTTRRLAEAHAADPAGWCETCQQNTRNP